MNDVGKQYFEEQCTLHNYTLLKMGIVAGPEKMKNTCGKTMHTGTMDRGFTVLSSQK
jgi:hypothetical protein